MKQVVSYQPLLDSEDYALGIIGRSEPMQNVFKLVGQLASSDATALITGESGTGKELVARSIYHHSKRSDRPFLAINCAAIPENLLESELFGHERGAFTGANVQRIGKFEQCNGGTLFLDEIGDMSLPTQAKILRVLQNGTFERVGGNQTVKVDVRIIAATNRLLEEAVSARQFREDLFYRLNVVRITLPSLRERRDDIPLLSDYFLKATADKQKIPLKYLSAEALSALSKYEWPGNVRELENVLQRAMVVSKADVILPQDLPREVFAKQSAPVAVAKNSGAAAEKLTGEPAVATLVEQIFRWARTETKLKVIPAVERELIIHALSEVQGNQVQAAKILGITRATLRKRIERFNIRREITVK
jgi:two-component system nitrogen regulation response regulator GlnG